MFAKHAFGQRIYKKAMKFPSGCAILYLHHSQGEENEIHENKDKGHNHIYDPHIWTSPVIAKQMLSNILEEIVKEDPENESHYREKADKYLKELDEIDSQFRTLAKEADIKTIYFADKFAMYYFLFKFILTLGLSFCVPQNNFTLSKFAVI